MNDLSIGYEADRTDWSSDFNRSIFDSITNNPFFSSWKTMTIGFGSIAEKQFDSKKLLNLLLSDKPKVSIKGYEEGLSTRGNYFLINRDHSYNGVRLQLKKEMILNKSVGLFQDYMVKLAIETPQFKRLYGSQGSEAYDIQKKHNIEQEKSLFSYMGWLTVVSPLAYNGFYEKEDLLKAPFYRVEEIKKDIVLIQAYKDPFDLENEESLNYLRKGVEYLNKNIIFLKEK
jgi:hypothetical protein